MIGDIGASDQKHQSHGGQEHQQRRLELTRDLFAEHCAKSWGESRHRGRPWGVRADASAKHVELGSRRR
jgi:hypothetical protein